jgi:hypothetical protein
MLGRLYSSGWAVGRVVEDEVRERRLMAVL